jgi:phosphatidylethanolamine/phosphatidyl-N-methylethanolamine N-methyltransferase
MTRKKSFLKQFWQEKKMVGSMVPSSKYLAKKMLSPINFNDAKVIIELGPGTGVFTQKIIENMRTDATLLVFELNDQFFEILKNNFSDPRVHFIHDSAEKIEEYMQLHHLEQADVVVSSLPLANFPKKLRDAILNASNKALKPVGQYIQFQYSLQSKKQLKKTFKEVQIGFTPLNFPPAFVYSCKKD